MEQMTMMKERSSEEISQEFGEDQPLQLIRKKILVVEDSKDSRDFICHLLRKAGADVQSASNGEEGEIGRAHV